MSVINTMLQDLDRRRGRLADHALPAGESVRSTASRSPWHVSRRTALALAALSAVTIAGLEWYVPSASASSIVQVAAAVPAPVPAPPQAPTLAAAAAPQAPGVVDAPAPAAAPPERAGATTPAALPTAAPAEPSARAPDAWPARTLPTAAKPTAMPEALPHAAADVPPPAPPPTPAAPAARAGGGKTYDAQQMAANLMAEAVALEQAGRIEEAKAPLQRALSQSAQDGAARQMLARLELESGRHEQARSLLTEGQRLEPTQPAYALLLARIKADAGDLGGAIGLLEGSLASAQGDAPYHATLAALQLREQRYDGAVQNYLVALRADPAEPTWLAGIGAALEATGRTADAAEAYRRIAAQPHAPAAVSAFAWERLTRLRPASVPAAP